MQEKVSLHMLKVLQLYFQSFLLIFFLECIIHFYKRKFVSCFFLFSSYFVTIPYNAYRAYFYFDLHKNVLSCCLFFLVFSKTPETYKQPLLSSFKASLGHFITFILKHKNYLPPTLSVCLWWQSLAHYVLLLFFPPVLVSCNYLWIIVLIVNLLINQIRY